MVLERIPRHPRRIWATTLLVLLMGLPACGTNVVGGGKSNPEVRVGPLHVSDVHVVHPPGGAYAVGAFATVDFLVQSSGQDRDALVGASTPVASRVELLLDGRTVDRVLAAPGQTVTRGTQLRLVDLRQRVEPGDRISVTFRFQGAGEVTVKAPVR
jgi:periplasmic copper chaperone A